MLHFSPFFLGSFLLYCTSYKKISFTTVADVSRHNSCNFAPLATLVSQTDALVMTWLTFRYCCEIYYCKNLKDPVPRYERSGVYFLQCHDCPSGYVQFKIQECEHIDDSSSAFGAHLMSTGHSYIGGSSKLLYIECNYYRRLAFEHIEIVMNKNNPNSFLLNEFTPDNSFI